MGNIALFTKRFYVCPHENAQKVVKINREYLKKYIMSADREKVAYHSLYRKRAEVCQFVKFDNSVAVFIKKTSIKNIVCQIL